MSNTSRVDTELFEGEHYLGKPADADDLIIQRRINILRRFPQFVGKDLHLLEIGCGNGNTMLKLASDFERVTGLEYAKAHMQEFEMLKKAEKADNAEFVPWDIMEAPYTPQADRLLSFEVIEHLPAESGVVNYAASVKEGAWCAFTVPNKWWIFETHGARLPLLPWNRVPFFSWLPKPIHERFANARIYTKKRIKNLLENSGFEVKEMLYVTAPMDVVKWPPLKNFLRKNVFGNDTTSIPFKAVSIFIIAQKRNK
jgi:2-polyprenyl-3-methyl-5-hydroxy-6-metoxy-1,4-benzoquinol methylase